MIYPDRLLPKPHFKIIAWNESLQNHFLIHSTESKDIKDPHTGKLSIDHVVRQTDHLKDYSNNLLGVFLVDDIYWTSLPCPKKDYFRSEWTEGRSVDAPAVPEEYSRNENKGFFYLKISDCHDVQIQFEDGSYVSPICKVMHTPTNANFWHFSIRWFFDGQDIDKWSEPIKRRMKATAKAFIVENARFGEPYYEEIEPNLYS